MATNKDIAQRIAGRKWAEEVLADLPADDTDEYRRAFMSLVKQCFRVQEIDSQALTDSEAREFGRRQMGFGIHTDKTYDECPLDYLEWLVDENFKLSRYLRSRRIREERKNDAED